MKTRIEKLNRLRIASPCSESWDGMAVVEGRRHCAKCHRQVFDFARMTPREIEARIASSGGRLCARIVRGAGGLVTLPSPEPPPFWIERRASSVASALVTALLGLGGAASGAALDPPSSTIPAGLGVPGSHDASASPDAQSATDSKAGRIDGVVKDQEGYFLPGVTATIQELDGGRTLARVTDTQGRFTFENVEPGIFLVKLDLEGFSPVSYPDLAVRAGRATRLDVKMESLVLEEITVGGMGIPSLRESYGGSDLVVTGVVGKTLPIDPRNSMRETEIRVASVLKGRYAGRTLRVSMYFEEDEKTFAPGARVLGFLDAVDAPPGGKVTYLPADGQRGLQEFSESELSAYAERIGALERISRRDGMDPEDLAAWLVATVEQPTTRGEETGDLSRALAALADTAKERNLAIAHAQADLEAEALAIKADGKALTEEESLRRAGAFITEAEKHRLVRALLATDGLSRGDLELFDIVRPWAEDPAVEWLTNRFREVEPADDGVNREAMARLAEALASDELKMLLKTSDDDLEDYFGSLPNGSWDHPEILQAEVEARGKELRKRFLEML